MMLRLTALLILLTQGVSALPAQTLDEFAPLADATSRFRAEVVMSGLSNPAGVTLSPTRASSGPYELLIAESGAGRVIEVSTGSFDAVEELVVGFPVGTLGPRGEYRVGPMDLAFVTRNKLAVTTTDSKGTAQVATYALQPSGPVLNAAQLDYHVRMRSQPEDARGNAVRYFGLAIAEKTCYVSAADTDSQNWILKCDVQANRLSPLKQYFDIEKHVGNYAGFNSPAAIAVIPSPRPALLVAGVAGTVTEPQDSRLVFVLPSSGEAVMDLPTGLDDIVSLAYSPTGQLYAADFSWRDEQAGGVYRIDDARINGRQTCRAVKIAAVVRPYGLVFAPDGSLFVTSFGTTDDASDGQLIKITGEL